MFNANLSPKLKEFGQCLHKWSRWKLSLLGKITVLNHLQFQNLFTHLRFYTVLIKSV